MPEAHTSSHAPPITAKKIKKPRRWSMRSSNGLSSAIITQVPAARRPSEATIRKPIIATEATIANGRIQRQNVSRIAVKKMMKLPIVTGSMNTEEARGRFEDGRKLRAPGRVALTNRLLS
ncbi:hypothetical protein NB689_001512 [Xanthomonas sacchari]|nr:hypothetical protein [Xanthomonas sacchari]